MPRKETAGGNELRPHGVDRTVAYRQGNAHGASRMSGAIAPPILVIGASGKFAGHVVPAVAERHARVRGVVRRPEEQADVRRHGADEAVIADLTDPTSLKRAFEGVE